MRQWSKTKIFLSRTLSRLLIKFICYGILHESTSCVVESVKSLIVLFFPSISIVACCTHRRSTVHLVLSILTVSMQTILYHIEKQDWLDHALLSADSLRMSPAVASRLAYGEHTQIGRQTIEAQAKLNYSITIQSYWLRFINSTTSLCI